MAAPGILQTPTPILKQQYKIITKTGERVPTADGFGTRWVETGNEEHTVEVTIDLPALLRVMGGKAVANRTGVSRDGFVTVKRVGKGKKL